MSYNAPPDDDVIDGGPAPGPPSERRKSNFQAPSTEQQAELARSFNEWVTSPLTHKELQKVLPDSIPVDVFVSTAKSAVMNNPKLLAENLRASLLLAVAKAAEQGLLPDGKQGALIPRRNNFGQYLICWQPMVRGIEMLGRRTGSIKKIVSQIVFRGEETAEIDEARNTIVHKRGSVEREIVDVAYAHLLRPGGHVDFLNCIDFAYCIITEPDGTEHMRWMPGARVWAIKNVSKADNGPWNSAFVDGMVDKTLILYTAKRIDLDPANMNVKRFQSALETDLDVDFEALDRERTELLQHQRQRAAIAAPGEKLDTIDELFAQQRRRETVPVGAVDEGSPTPSSPGRTQEAVSAASETGGGAGGSPPPDPSPGPGGALAAAVAPDQGQPPAGENEPPAGGDKSPEDLEARVVSLETELPKRSIAAVEKMVKSANYIDFIAALSNADRLDLMKRVADAVEKARKGGTDAHA